MTLYKPILKSYFSGAGGLDWGTQEAGCEVIQSLEYDQMACHTLGMNFKHNVVTEDIREITVLSQCRSDAIIGTYPCTRYSKASTIHKTQTGEDLFLHFFRHIVLEQPEAYVIENVPGMRRFPVVMEAMSKLPGYYINIFCPLDAKNWLPQRRERLILFGTKKPFSISPPTPSNNRPLMRDIIERDVPISTPPQYVLNRINGLYRDNPIVSDPNNKHELAPTCVAHYFKDLSTRMVKDKSHPLGIRSWTVREYARLQGFPDSFKFSGADSHAYKQIGNAVPIPMGRWIGKQLVKYFN